MQFSRKFLIGSLALLIAAFFVWNVAAEKGWIKDSAEEAAAEEQEGKGNQEGKAKVDKAFKSLNKKMGGKETPIKVEAAPAFRGALVQRVSAQGRVHAYKKVDLVNEVAGKLIKLKVRDGDVVRKGQVIGEIDDFEYRLNFEEAEASYLAAKADFVVFDREVKLADEKKADQDQRLKELKAKLDRGEISRDDHRRQSLAIELDQIRAGGLREDVIRAKTLDQAYIKVERARNQLEKCAIRAPFSGVVYGLEVSAGSYLNASTKIAQLINMKDLVIKAQVLESEIGQVYEGRPTRVRFTALPVLDLIDGKVKAISPFINEEDKTVETVVTFASSDKRIRPGMFAEVIIDSQIHEDRLLVPKLAILPRDNRKVIFKVGEDKRAKWVYVKTGVENDEYVEILEGKLEPGDMVLTDNHFTMGHDTLVKVSKKK